MAASSPSLAALGLLAACCAPPQGQEKVKPLALVRVAVPKDLGERALAHVRNLVQIGERRTGTPGWQKSLDYIARSLEAAGVAVERDRWHDVKEDVEFENVIGRIPGTSEERILLAAHHDTKCCSGHDDPAHNFPFAGANDSGSGVGLLLELAKELVKAKHKATIELVFFDGEESMTWDWNKGVRALFGSRRFVAKERELAGGKPKPPIRALVLLDMVGAKDLQIDDETNSDAELRQVVGAAARACGHERYFFANKQQVSDDHLPFIDAGIKAIDLVDIFDNPEWHTKNDTIERMAPESLQIVGEVVLTALPEIERRFVRADAAASRPAEKR